MKIIKDQWRLGKEGDSEIGFPQDLQYCPGNTLFSLHGLIGVRANPYGDGALLFSHSSNSFSQNLRSVHLHIHKTSPPLPVVEPLPHITCITIYTSVLTAYVRIYGKIHPRNFRPVKDGFCPNFPYLHPGIIPELMWESIRL